MLFLKTEVRKSSIAGEGVFAREGARFGALLGDLTYGGEFLSEERYQQAQAEGDHVIIQCAVRLAGKMFVYDVPEDKEGEPVFQDEDYINHSDDPTMLYHCGLLFARRDINEGDELTVDYKYFLAVKDVFAFKDKFSGKPVDGVSGPEALLDSTRELLDILTRSQGKALG